MQPKGKDFSASENNCRRQGARRSQKATSAKPLVCLMLVFCVHAFQCTVHCVLPVGEKTHRSVRNTAQRMNFKRNPCNANAKQHQKLKTLRLTRPWGLG
eukprot:6487378-Amphidinium_carterae.1